MSKLTASILLCTYNGEKYLQEQLNSILTQTHEYWKIYASDDGSRDNTLAILNAFKAKHPQRIEILEGEQKGLCRNFLSLAENRDIQSAYYAFCDQDDIWLPEKLERAIEVLENQNDSLPLAYFSRSILVSAEGKPYGQTALMQKEPSFRNALVQSLAAGNTAVFNHHTKMLFEKTKGLNPVIHDWWLYLLVTGVNGKVIYDKHASIHYRQHGANVIGEKKGWDLFKTRLKRVFGNEIKAATTQNLIALNRAKEKINFQNNKALLEDFSTARRSGFLKRVIIYRKQGLYRQGFLANLSLIFAVIFNKF